MDNNKDSSSLLSNRLNAAALASNIQQLRENLANGSSPFSNAQQAQALTAALGLTSTLQLGNLWENPLISAAMSQYVDASLINLKANIDQLNTNGVLNGAALNGNGFNLPRVDDKEEQKNGSPQPSAAKRLRTNDQLFAATSGKDSLSYLDTCNNFPCTECHKTFATEVDLKAHLIRHQVQHPHLCPTCGKGFKYDHTLDFHIKSAHGQESGSTSTARLSAKLSSKKASSNGKHRSDNEVRPKKSQLVMDLEFEDLNNNNIPANMGKGPASLGSPALDLPLPNSFPNHSVQVKSEKVLIVMLEGINPLTEQSYALYKCNICGYAYPSLGPVADHVQNTHPASHSCDKCGANFKQLSELLYHEQLHKAMDTGAYKQMLVNPLLQPNLLLMNQYFAATNSLVLDKNNNDAAIDTPPLAQSPLEQLPEQGLNLSSKPTLNVRKESESSVESNSRRTSRVSKELRNEEIDELSRNIAVVKESNGNELGEIEETAPGQFKCRYCDKTFDRIFSVHRHERVHTGFKPCLCKVCGRGFSEKRNLRHHIIRFHSDGSGRELLRRVRKDKSAGGAASSEDRRQLKMMEMSLLGAAGLVEGTSGQSIQSDSEEAGSAAHVYYDADMNGANGESLGEELMDSGSEGVPASLNDENDVDSANQMSVSSVSSNGSSSARRRKSTPCKKMSDTAIEELEEEEELEEDEMLLQKTHKEDGAKSKSREEQPDTLKRNCHDNEAAQTAKHAAPLPIC